MQKIRVDNFSISLDGFGAGPHQDINHPLGMGGMALHQWLFSTDTFQQMVNGKPGEQGIDNDFAVKSFEKVGACIMGKNMFGPANGQEMDNNWRGWWGPNPPFHCPVYVLTHHRRASIPMEGGTVFHFVTEGIEVALEQAKGSASGQDIRIGGGVHTIAQYLEAGLIDQLHIVMVPVILGAGERLFENIDLAKLGYKCIKNVASEKAMHLLIRRKQ